MIPPSDLPEVNKIDSVKNNSPKSGSEKVSSDKIKALREAIANGTYQINAKAIAEGIVKSGVLDE